jgi:hypothetical protein
MGSQTIVVELLRSIALLLAEENGHYSLTTGDKTFISKVLGVTLT